MSRRLAVFAPVPPAASGIAEYVDGLLSVLPADWSVEVFTDGATAAGWSGAPTYALAAWAERQAREPFDLNMYHVGNNALHATTLPFVLEHPGLLVLHDVVLHPARAATSLQAANLRAYDATLAACAPSTAAAAAQVVAAGMGGASLYWSLPLCADLVRASRHTVVHGTMLARWLQAQLDGVSVGSVVHWLPVAEADDEVTASWRNRLGAAAGVPIFGTFGHIGPEHRVDLVLEALATLAPEFDFRLAVVGSPAPEIDLPAAVLARGLTDRVTFTGRVDEQDYGALLRAVDLGLNLRYPTARASSGPLVQLLRVGTPAVIHDLVHLRDVPAPAVLRVPTGEHAHEREALIGQLRDWLSDPDLRSRAARRAAEWAADTLTRAAMRASYLAAIDTALERPKGA